jgi:glycolate oxidase
VHPGLTTDPVPSALAPGLLRELEAIVGSRGVIRDPERLLVYESDGLTQYRVPPRAVVLPGTESEVARVLATLHVAGIPIVPRGAGTGLSGGALAMEGGVLVGTSRLSRIVSVDPTNRSARIQPGVINAHLTRATLPHGLIYAPDPSSQSACTLGGNVAENSGGPHCLKYGVTSRYVTALRVALPDGSLVDLGGPDTLGELDLLGAFIGSEGCFGVAVEIEVALIPAPEGARTLLGIFHSMKDAGRAVTAIMAEGLLPAALEIVDRETIRAVEASVFAAGFPTDAGAALVVEFDGLEAGLDEALQAAGDLCRTHGAREVRLARTSEERQAVWLARKKAFGAMGRIAPDLLVQDATVPRSQLPRVLAEIQEIGERHQLTVANVFHAGDGNLHPNLLFDRRDPDQLARVEAASSEIMHACIAAGGTITGEHGVGIDKRRYLPLVCEPAVLWAMGELRRVFDPEGRCNPGKVLPDGFGPPWPRTPPPPSRTAPGPTGKPSRVAPSDIGPSDITLSADDLVVQVGAAVTLGQLQEVAAEKGMWFPLDPAGGSDQTLASLIETGATGPLGTGYGGLRDHLLGVTLDTPSGLRLPLGGRVVKNVAGFDLVRLVVGSQGALGHVHNATLRLFPIPPQECTLLWDAEEPDAVPALLDLVDRLRQTGLPFAAATWLRSPQGPCATLALRLMGTPAEVQALQDAALRAAGAVHPRPGSLSVRHVILTQRASAGWWDAMSMEGLQGPRRCQERLACAPRATEALVSALATLPPGTEPWVALHVFTGGGEIRRSEGTPLPALFKSAVEGSGTVVRRARKLAFPDPTTPALRVRRRLLEGVVEIFTTPPAHSSALA